MEIRGPGCGARVSTAAAVRHPDARRPGPTLEWADELGPRRDPLCERPRGPPRLPSFCITCRVSVACHTPPMVEVRAREGANVLFCRPSRLAGEGDTARHPRDSRGVPAHLQRSPPDRPRRHRSHTASACLQAGAYGVAGSATSFEGAGPRRRHPGESAAFLARGGECEQLILCLRRCSPWPADCVVGRLLVATVTPIVASKAPRPPLMSEFTGRLDLIAARVELGGFVQLQLGGIDEVAPAGATPAVVSTWPLEPSSTSVT